jgi:IS30 family transposase
MKRLPAMMRKSMTYDRGSEMACHPELARRLKIDIWFCDPHAPWQRGSNENTNGLLRQFMPKGADLSDASQTWLNDVANLMNNRPRKTLGWKTPAKTMADEIEAFSSNVALDIGIQALRSSLDCQQTSLAKDCRFCDTLYRGCKIG